MNVTFNRSALRKAVSLASAAVPTRSQKPVLRNLLFSCNEGKVSITGTSLDVAVQATIDCEFDSPGQFLLPSDKISAITAESGADEIRIHANGSSRATVKAGSSEWAIGCDSVDLFPVTALPDGAVRVAAITLAEAFRRTVFASNDTSKTYSFGGVLVEFKDNELWTAATDGNRMSVNSCRVEMPDSFTPPDKHTIVPAAAVKKLISILPDSGAVFVFVDDGKFVATTEGFRFSAQLFEGQFVKTWRDYIEQPPGYMVFDVPVSQLRSAIRQVAIALDIETTGISLDLSPGTFKASGRCATGNASAEIPIAYQGESKSVALNHSLLSQFLAVLPAEESVTVNFGGERMIHLSQKDSRYMIAVFGEPQE